MLDQTEAEIRAQELEDQAVELQRAREQRRRLRLARRRVVRERLSNIGRAVPDLAVDAFGVAGGGLVGYGAWQIYHPAGFIVGGFLMIVGSWLFARGASS